MSLVFVVYLKTLLVIQEQRMIWIAVSKELELDCVEESLSKSCHPGISVYVVWIQWQILLQILYKSAFKKKIFLKYKLILCIWHRLVPNFQFILSHALQAWIYLHNQRHKKSIRYLIHTLSTRQKFYAAEFSLKISRSSANQDSPFTSWNPKAHYRVHNSLQLVPILRKINPIHTSNITFSRLILILSSHLGLGLPRSFHHSRFSTKTTYASLLYP